MSQKLPRPEEERTRGSGAAGAGPAARDRDLEEYRSTSRWVLRLGAVGTLAVGLFNVVAFLQTGAWQMLALVGAAALALACLVVSWRRFAQWQRLARARRAIGKDDASQADVSYSYVPLYEAARFRAASYWALAGMILLLAVVNLVHQGIAVQLFVGGLLLTLIVGLLLLPRRWYIWLAVMVGYGLYVWLIDWLEPLPRYDLARMGSGTDVFVLVLIGFLVLAALWALIQTYRRIIAIRLRLLLSFAVVVLLTLVIVATALVLVGSQNGRQQAINQLESIANIKQAEIGGWLAGVQADLDAVVSDSEVMPRVLVVLENPELSPAQEFFTWSYLRQVVAQAPRLQALSLLDQSGRMVLSTDTGEQGEDAGVGAAPLTVGLSPSDVRTIFEQGLQGFYLAPPAYSESVGRVVIAAARPIVDQEGRIHGVLMGSVEPASLSEILGALAWVGETGEIYLLDGQGHLLSDLRHAAGQSQPSGLSAGPFEVGGEPAAQTAAATTYADYRGVSVVGIQRWLPELGVALVAKQDTAEALSLTNSLLRVLGIASLAAFGVAVGVSLVVTQGITRPLADLTEVSERIAGGDLSLAAPIGRRDEIGRLAHRFNTMTAQLRELIGSLEERVADRTQELERRSTYLEASSEIGRATSSILDPEQLIRTAVELVRSRFGLSAVGLFLVDAEQEWAVMRAGRLQVGDVAVEEGQRIAIGKGASAAPLPAGQSHPSGLALTSWCIQRAQVQVSPEGGQEVALPLRSRGQVLGALTVQGSRPGAFDEDTLAALQTMADQVAVALDNARLFVESQQALEAERQAYGQIGRDAWARLIQDRRMRGYRCDEEGVAPLTDGTRPPAAGPSIRGPQMTIPVVVRDQTIAVLNFSKAEAGASWSAEEVALGQNMTEGLGQALESARLYADTQRRAAQERLIGEVTARFRQTLDIDTVLQTAVQEMRQALGFAEVEVFLDPAPSTGSAPSEQE